MIFDHVLGLMYLQNNLCFPFLFLARVYQMLLGNFKKPAPDYICPV